MPITAAIRIGWIAISNVLPLMMMAISERIALLTNEDSAIITASAIINMIFR